MEKNYFKVKTINVNGEVIKGIVYPKVLRLNDNNTFDIDIKFLSLTGGTYNIDEKTELKRTKVDVDIKDTVERVISNLTEAFKLNKIMILKKKEYSMAYDKVSNFAETIENSLDVLHDELGFVNKDKFSEILNKTISDRYEEILCNTTYYGESPEVHLSIKTNDLNKVQRIFIYQSYSLGRYTAGNVDFLIQEYDGSYCGYGKCEAAKDYQEYARKYLKDLSLAENKIGKSKISTSSSWCSDVGDKQSVHIGQNLTIEFEKPMDMTKDNIELLKTHLGKMQYSIPNFNK